MRNRLNTMEELLAGKESDPDCENGGNRRDLQSYRPLESPSKYRSHRSDCQHHCPGRLHRTLTCWYSRCYSWAGYVWDAMVGRLVSMYSLLLQGWKGVAAAALGRDNRENQAGERSYQRVAARLLGGVRASSTVRDQETQPCSSDSNSSGGDHEILSLESGDWECSSPETKTPRTPTPEAALRQVSPQHEQVRHPLKLVIPRAHTKFTNGNMSACRASPSSVYNYGSPLVSPSPSTTPRSPRLVCTTGSASPFRSPRLSPRAPSIIIGFGEEQLEQKVVLWGPAGSVCSLCGYTLENGEDVVTAPSCTDGIKHHTTCFSQSELVFEDSRGSQTFGCDCGQFHPGTGLTEGVFALRADPSTPALSPGYSPRAGGGEKGGDAGSVYASMAVEACPLFEQADPLALTIVNERVGLRPAVGGGGPASIHRMAINPDDLAVRFGRQDVLSKAEAGHILDQGTMVLDSEDNVLRVEGETVVVGDLHGQFFDLLNIFDTCGRPPLRQYLFLGDYVDRGSFSCEVALYLISLKIAFPDKVYLLRGNHETANQTAECGFERECCAKYGSEMYEKFLGCFSALPVCAILAQQGQEKSLFCVHGGISPRLGSVEDIRKLHRKVEPEDGSLLADLLWSDPSDDESPRCITDTTGKSSPRPASEGMAGFKPNLVRGCSWSYDLSAVEAFLEENSFRGILRAHSVQVEGFHQHFSNATSMRRGGNEDRGWTSSTMGVGVSTVFSAPMYTSYHNRGGVLLVRDDGRVDALSYDAAPEPQVTNSTQAAVRASCPFMPTSLAEWAAMESETRSLRAAMREKPMRSDTFTDQEALALRVLWEAMSGGGDFISEESLFGFDDVFGDGKSCLQVGDALRALSPNGQAVPAAAGEFLLLARALKTSSVGGL